MKVKKIIGSERTWITINEIGQKEGAGFNGTTAFNILEVSWITLMSLWRDLLYSKFI